MLTAHSVVTGKKLKKDRLLIFVAIMAVSVILLSAFLVAQQIHPASTPVIELIQSASGYYLSYMGNVSRIFVVSANASYGNYPTRTSPTGVVWVENGEPCIIINVTIRNDYSTQYPPPDSQSNNPTLAYVYLTAQLFNGKNQINATDLLQVGLPPDAGAVTWLSGGESATLTLYLGTNNTDITSFQIVARYITGLPLP